MNTTLKDWISTDSDRQRLFAQERLIVAVAEHIWERMEQQEVNKSGIAAALGKSKAFITQLLNGTRNMTLRTLSDIAFALNAEIDIRIHPKRSAQDWSVGSADRAFTDVVSEDALTHNASRSGDSQKGNVIRIKYPEAA
jgi:transcriptional regulator with XRE-family HTH domain